MSTFLIALLHTPIGDLHIHLEMLDWDHCVGVRDRMRNAWDSYEFIICEKVHLDIDF